MIKDTRFTDQHGAVLMLGNEAIVRGSLEAGVSYVAQYPGTPTSDIGETFQTIIEQESIFHEALIHHWAINEAVASSECAGAAWTGCKVLNPMKHVGLNVASDALSVIALNGPNPGAMVIVVGADPGSLGSHQEQNERFYTWMFHFPCLEPHTPQECKDFTKLAFELSEKYDTVFEIRTSTRSAHSRGYVDLEPLSKGLAKGKFIRNIPKFNSLPPHAINNHIRLYERIEAIRKIIPTLNINKVYPGKNSIGIITSGMSFGYSIEALNQLGLGDVPILKLGMIYPLNYEEITNFIRNLKKVIIIEELEPFLEVKIAEIAQKFNIKIEILGQEYFPKYNEYSTGLVANRLAKLFEIESNHKINDAIELYDSYKEIIPSRFPTFCAGCPERATLYTILKATNGLENTVVCGDIGCFVMSFFPPQQCSDLIICMSGGLSAAIGISEKTDQKIIALIGDSTFLHTGMAPLTEAANYDSNILLFVFENNWTAMTGHQPVLGLTEKRLSIEKICNAVGVSWVKVEDSYNPKQLIKTINEGLNTKGFKVIIVKRECALQAHRWRQTKIKELTQKGNKVQEISYYIGGCQLCYECARILSCPALRKVRIDNLEEMQIDQERCIKCGVCYEICPNGAIRKSIINLFEEEVPFREL
jgi:indolepyruvate ferredoxin oxidoreductase alpha subunit